MMRLKCSNRHSADRRPVASRTVALATALLAMALFAAPGASADFTVCAGGSGAGQCSNPNGVAVDTESGRVYVADRGNNRIDAFAEDGSFLYAVGWDVIPGGGTEFERCTTISGCKAGTTGSGNGQLNGPRRVAVDNGAASPSRHDFYVFDSGNKRVQKFSPEGAFLGKKEGEGTGPGQFNESADLIAIGPDGDVYVADMPKFEKEPRVERFDESLALLEECTLPLERRFISLAIGPGGEAYAAFSVPLGILRFEPLPSCAQAGSPFPLDPDLEVRSVAADAAGGLYAGQGESKVLGFGFYRMIGKYSAAGATERRYGYGALGTGAVPGLAPLPGAGGVYAAEEASGVSLGQVRFLAEPPPGPVIAAASAQEPTGNVRATLQGEVNPEGKATEYEFEYLTQQAYEDQGESFAGPATQTSGPIALGASGFTLAAAGAAVGCTTATVEAIKNKECLTPESAYRFRLSASNADGVGAGPVEGTFDTGPPGEIEEAFASEVGVDSARLSAVVNPRGIPTSGYFEYVTEARFQESGFTGATEAPDVSAGAASLDFGSGEAGARRSVTVQLQPGTAYRFRAVASDELLEEGGLPPLESEALALRTYAIPASERCPANEAFRGGASSLLADCRAYELVSPLDKEGGDIAYLKEAPYILPAVLSQSAVVGGKLAYGSYRAFGDAVSAPYAAQYIATRGKEGWSSHYILGPRENLDIQAAFVTDSELKALSPDLCQAWIHTVAEPKLAPGAVEGRPNLYRRTDRGCGAEGYEALTTVTPSGKFFFNPELQGTSADGGKAIYLAKAKLTPEAPDDALALYYQAAGEGTPRYVCYLPDGNVYGGGCGAGTTPNSGLGKGRSGSVIGAISADGERVFWSTGAPGTSGQLYLRLRPGQPQSTTGCEAAKACTIAVSKKGEEESGSSSAQFRWAAADGSRAIYTTGNGDLFEYEVEGAVTTPIAGEVLGVMGASADARRLYFASKEDLGAGPNSQGDSAVAGDPNLYLREAGGGMRFVATLATLTEQPFEAARAYDLEPVDRSARVSPDGLHAAFMSTAPLTGYDNTDAASGEADFEVFLYDASAEGGAGKLVCASCNPSGGRPRGAVVRESVFNRQVAAHLPVWKSMLYPGRMLSDDGSRLYFEASDSLAPGDSNSAPDVYQWEAPGSGTCGVASPAYSSQDEGCLSLISSGKSEGGAAFLDASADGTDVFFTTAASLLAQDYGLIDAYDARAGGGLPPPPSPPAACEGEACQPAAVAPNDQTPASAVFRGPGNLAQPARARRCPKGKRKVKRRGKVRCIRRHRQRRTHRRHRAHHRHGKPMSQEAKNR